MKQKKITAILILAITAIGVAIGAWHSLTKNEQDRSQGASLTSDGAKEERKILYWTDPMIPGFKSDKPGKSPMNMDMIPVYEDEATHGSTLIVLRPEIVQNLGVRTHKVTRGIPPRRLVTTGYLFRDHKGIAVLIDVFDRDVGWIKPGIRAEVRVTDIPGLLFSGTVERVEPDIDIGVRALKARVRLHDHHTKLKPNMLADVSIYGARANASSIFIPREALIRTGTRNAVVLALGGGQFQPVEVTPGIESDDWVEIRQGIKPDDTVVTSGQFLIDSEASVRASFSRMQSEKEAEQSPENSKNDPSIAAEGKSNAEH